MTTAIPRPFPGPTVREKRAVLRGADLTPSSFLDPYARAFGDRPALFVDRDLSLPSSHPRTLTYDELRDLAARFAAVYADAGLRPGDAVAFLTPNRAELAVGMLGALRAGLVVVPLSALLTAAELERALKDADACALVTDAQSLAVLGNSADAVERVFLLDHTPDGGSHLSIPALLDAADPRTPPVPADPEAPALVFFTSGTTGDPKGATIPHRALGWVIARQARIAANLPSARSQLGLLVMPLAHTGGFITLVVTACLGVPSLVLSRFDAREVLRTIERERPTIFAGSPAMYRLLLEAGAEGYDLSSIRIWGGGADVFDRELLDRLRSLGGWRRFGLRFRPFTVIGYGASETAGQVTLSPPIPFGDRCIGWVLPGFEHRVVGDDGRDAPRGQTGELWLRGGSLMSGYWNDPEGLSDGWFHTGDLVRRGRFGVLFYESRRKDVIKSGGYSIAAREIERVLEEHPAVAMAAAIGLPDPVKGERPVGAVVLTPDGAGTSPADLETWAAERLARYKRPRRVYILDSFPVSSTFKPRKPDIREILLRSS